MTTTVNFDLSATLQTTLTNAGSNTYAYAFAFGASTSGGSVGLVDYVTLVDGGVVQASPSLSLSSPGFYSGAIYVVIQQNGDGTLPTQITDIADIATLSQSENFSYQLYEMTLSGSSNDLGDISALNTFGFTSTLEVVYQSGSETRGFQTSASSIFGALPADAVADYASNAFPDPEMLATGPATANDQAPWPASDWQAYVDALKSPDNRAVLNEIQIVYAFQGSASDGTAMLSQYSVQYVEKDRYGEDYFWLIPDTTNGATNTDWIQITASELVDNIYIQNGELTYYPGSKAAIPQQYSSFTPTNPDGGVAKHFVAGFDAGFWGGVGTSPNSLVTTTLDFSKGYNWNVNYAYDAALIDGVGSAGFTNSLLWLGGGQFYDPWAKQFVANSNAYGYSYSDLVSAGGVNPQISMYDTATGLNVATVNITLYDTGETPSSGFTQSSTGYIAPTSGTYEDSLTTTTNQIGFNFNFSVGSTMFAPDEATSIVFRIYAPSSPQADADGFISLNLTTASNSEDWYYYIINENAGTWSVQLSNATGLNGFFNIQNIPVTSDGSPSWYQLVFGEGNSQSIYNIYATSDQSTGAFTELVVDHGIEVTENSDTNYTLAFAPAGHMFYDINTFSPPPTSDPDSAGSTIIGSNRTDFVNALDSVGSQGLPTGGADQIYGRGGHDYLSGLAGNDILDGGAGVDMVRGNEGDDILLVRGNEGVFDYFNGGDDTDTLQFVGNGAVTLNGFDAAAASIEILQGNGRGLFGTALMDVFDLSGLTAAPISLPFIDAGRGNDVLTGSDFADTLYGSVGDDTLEGGDGNDTLDGGGGVDTLDGGTGADILIVRGSEGLLDTLDGGTGTDTLQLIGPVVLTNFDATASSIEILQGSGRGLFGTNQADTIDLSGLTAAPTNVPFIDGGRGNDVLTGSNFADSLYGAIGDDTLNGGDGNDILDGGAGIDTVNGGADNDTLLVRGNEGIGDTFNGGTGTDTLRLFGGVTLAGFDAMASSIEVLQGSGRGLFGTNQADVFDLSGLTAVSRVPFVEGGGGNDTLIGASFSDYLSGGAGDDILDGRGGNDILSGGAGSNTYVFADGYGADRVVTFNVGMDTFDLTGVTGVNSFADLVLTQINRNTVLIDFGGGDSLTIEKTTIAILTANQGDFLL